MNNAVLSEKIKGYLKSAAAKAKKFEDTVAVSISLLTENNEDLYVAVREGKILVAPYAYDDNGCAIEAAPEFIDKIFSGALSFDEALEKGYVKVKSGDVAKFKALEVLVPSKKDTKAAPKAAAKKADAKKAAAKPAPKAVAKPAPKAEVKAAPKAEVKPAPKAEVKAAPKAEVKPAPKAEVKAAPKAEVKAAPKAEVKAAPKADVKPAAPAKKAQKK